MAQYRPARACDFSDLRRAIGLSTHKAAARFDIGVATAGRWYRRYRDFGEMETGKQGQPGGSKLDCHEGYILGLVRDKPDITLHEIASLTLIPRSASLSMVRCVCATGPSTAPNGASSKMTRLRGRAKPGGRSRAAVPHGQWKTTTFSAGLRLEGVVAPMVLDGPMNGDAFIAYTQQLLAPELKSGNVFIMDNLPAHRVTGVRKAIEKAGGALALPTAILAGSKPHRKGILYTQGTVQNGRDHNHPRIVDGNRASHRRIHSQ